MKTVKIKDIVIPALGLGTWKLSGQECCDIVIAALEEGWRHIDTAAAYGNEEEIGASMRQVGLPREDVFLTTKAWYDRLDPQGLIDACEESLDRLGMDYADLFLIHWPNPEVPLKESIAGLLELKEMGWVKAIGVSNFPAKMMGEAQQHAQGALVVNQVEYHPLLAQKRVLAAGEATGMALTAYSPLAKGAVAGLPLIRDIAGRHGKTPAQVALRWLIQQKNVIAVPKTSHRERLAENAGAYAFELSDAEMAAISALGRPEGRTVNPAWAPQWDPE